MGKLTQEKGWFFNFHYIFLKYRYSTELYSTLLICRPQIPLCQGGCWNWTQTYCDFGTDSRRSNHAAGFHPMRHYSLGFLFECCGSGIRCLFYPGSGIRSRFFIRIPGPKHIFLMAWWHIITVCKKYLVFWQKKYSLPVKIKLFTILWYLWLQKMVPPSLLVLLLDRGSGIRDKHPGSTLLFYESK